MFKRLLLFKGHMTSYDGMLLVLVYVKKWKRQQETAAKKPADTPKYVGSNGWTAVSGACEYWLSATLPLPSVESKRVLSYRAVKLQTGWRMIALSIGTKYIWCHMLGTLSASFLSISCTVICYTYTRVHLYHRQQDKKKVLTPSGRINLMIDQPDKVNAHINLSHWAIVCYIVFLCFLMCNQKSG